MYSVTVLQVLVSTLSLRNDASGQRDLPHPPRGDLAPYARP